MPTTKALTPGSAPFLPARPRAVERRSYRSIAPVLDAPESRPAAALARLTGSARPVVTFLAGVLVAYVGVALLSTLLGLLLTDVVLKIHWIATADGRAPGFFAHHRDRPLTEASLIGSIIAGGVVLPALAGALALCSALLRQWRVAALFVFALAVESASYRTTTFFVERNRPAVHRLENLPANESYPSGHTAAAVAVYCGAALLLTSRLTQRWQRIGVWAVAVLIPLYVAWARMYRGMHHPLDCLGGAIVGVAALAALIVACRAAGIAAETRATRASDADR